MLTTTAGQDKIKNTKNAERTDKCIRIEVIIAQRTSDQAQFSKPPGACFKKNDYSCSMLTNLHSGY